MNNLLYAGTFLGALYGVVLALREPPYGSRRPGWFERLWSWPAVVVAGAVLYGLVGWWVAMIAWWVLTASSS